MSRVRQHMCGDGETCFAAAAAILSSERRAGGGPRRMGKEEACSIGSEATTCRIAARPRFRLEAKALF